MGTITNLNTRPQRRDEQAVGAGQHAVHDARLRSVEHGRQQPVRVVERQKDPARHDRVEQVVLQEPHREVRVLVARDLEIEVVEARRPRA